jgi:hypothetical protein
MNFKIHLICFLIHLSTSCHLNPLTLTINKNVGQINFLIHFFVCVYRRSRMGQQRRGRKCTSSSSTHTTTTTSHSNNYNSTSDNKYSSSTTTAAATTDFTATDKYSNYDRISCHYKYEPELWICLRGIKQSELRTLLSTCLTYTTASAGSSSNSATAAATATATAAAAAAATTAAAAAAATATAGKDKMQQESKPQ